MPWIFYKWPFEIINTSSKSEWAGANFSLLRQRLWRVPPSFPPSVVCPPQEATAEDGEERGGFTFDIFRIKPGYCHNHSRQQLSIQRSAISILHEFSDIKSWYETWAKAGRSVSTAREETRAGLLTKPSSWLPWFGDPCQLAYTIRRLAARVSFHKIIDYNDYMTRHGNPQSNKEKILALRIADALIRKCSYLLNG